MSGCMQEQCRPAWLFALCAPDLALMRRLRSLVDHATDANSVLRPIAGGRWPVSNASSDLEARKTRGIGTQPASTAFATRAQRGKGRITMAKDPVCGMSVNESTAVKVERDGQTYYFCCEACRQKFMSGSASTRK